MQTETLAPQPKTAETNNPWPVHHVLVVDDEEANRTLLRDPLEARGYEISEAENGLKALQLAAQRPPDTILLDVMMPGMDGFQVCRRLKKDRLTSHIPVLMV